MKNLFLMKPILKTITINVGWLLYYFLITFVVVEIVFTMLPTSDSLETKAVNASQPIFKFKESRLVTHQVGFNFKHVSTKKVNNMGFLNDVDYHKNDFGKNAVVIGDSYVEALQIDNKDSIVGLLNNATKNNKVFGIAVSGAPLSQYVAFAEFAQTTLNPTQYIFVIINNDFDQALQKYKNAPGFHHYNDELTLVRNDYTPNPFATLLRKSSFFRYLHQDLKVQYQFKRFVNYFSTNKIPYRSDSGEKYEKRRINDSLNVISKFLKDIKDITRKKDVIFVLDGDRESIYSGFVKRARSYEATMYEYFMEDASKYESFKVIDLHPTFYDEYKKNKQKFNFDYDYHWNETGHFIAFQSIKRSGFLRLN